MVVADEEVAGIDRIAAARERGIGIFNGRVIPGTKDQHRLIGSLGTNARNARFRPRLTELVIAGIATISII